MGKSLADQFPEAAVVFAEVDDALGEKLSAVIWEGPAETLTLTENAQPALDGGQSRRAPRARGEGSGFSRTASPMSPVTPSASIRRSPPPAR